MRSRFVPRMAGNVLLIMTVCSLTLPTLVTALTPEEAAKMQAELDAYNINNRRSFVRTPVVYVQDNNLNLLVPEDKQICFKNASSTICVNEMATSADLSAYETKMDELVQSTLIQGLQTQSKLLEKQDEQIAALNASNAALNASDAALKASDVFRCGRSCYQGEYASQQCSKLRSTQCTACPSKSFSFGGLPSSCTQCTICSPAQFQKTTCTSVSDTDCQPCKQCPMGHFVAGVCVEGSTTHCKPITNCSTGFFEVTAPTLVSNRVCKKCAAKCGDGEFRTAQCSAKLDLQCKSCSKCPKSQPFQLSGCTATSDTTCVSFASGNDKSMPAKNCRNLYVTWQKAYTNRETTAGPKSGKFWIDPAGKNEPFRVYCDMEERSYKDGAGWTLVFVIEGSTFRAWHSNCPEKELLDYKQKGGGCAKGLVHTLGKAKYIRYTDFDLKPFILAEFQTVGDYYKDVFVKGNDRSTVRYLKGDWAGKGWVSIMAQRKNFGHYWGHYGWPDGGHRCWEDTNARDRPFYKVTGNHGCEGGYSPKYSWNTGISRRGGNMNYVKWIREEGDG